jgi:hypothetical protein
MMRCEVVTVQEAVYIRKISHVTGPNRRSLSVGPNRPQRARVGPAKDDAGP